MNRSKRICRIALTISVLTVLGCVGSKSNVSSIGNALEGGKTSESPFVEAYVQYLSLIHI